MTDRDSRRRDPACRQTPGLFRPVIDRAACEGKGDCERVCPCGVFAIGTLPREQRAGLGPKGTLKGFAHRWQQALLVDPGACEACALCVAACPEDAITLARAPSFVLSTREASR